MSIWKWSSNGLTKSFVFWKSSFLRLLLTKLSSKIFLLKIPFTHPFWLANLLWVEFAFSLMWLRGNFKSLGWKHEWSNPSWLHKFEAVLPSLRTESAFLYFRPNIFFRFKNLNIEHFQFRISEFQIIFALAFQIRLTQNWRKLIAINEVVSGFCCRTFLLPFSWLGSSSIWGWWAVILLHFYAKMDILRVKFPTKFGFLAII